METPEGTTTDLFVARMTELLNGTRQGEPVWITDGGPDYGLHGTLNKLTAAQASTPHGETSIAAHAGHLVFSIEMVNRYVAGLEAEGSWESSWSHRLVDEREWQQLRARLKEAGDELLTGAARSIDWTDAQQANGAFATLGHTAYHVGAIRHMAAAQEAESEQS